MPPRTRGGLWNVALALAALAVLAASGWLVSRGGFDVMPAPAVACASCGMDAAASDTRIVLGDAHPGEEACSAGCARRALAREMGAETPGATGVLARDLPSGRLVPAAHAWFVYGSAARLRGSMPPIAPAFADRTEADAHAREHGGDVVAWDELVRRLAAADARARAAAGRE